MIEQINLAIVGESGEIVLVESKEIEMKLEIAIADTFSEICRRNNSIGDAEIKRAEKFFFAVNLQKYLKEMKENVRTNHC